MSNLAPPPIPAPAPPPVSAVMDYTPRLGAACPACGRARARVVGSEPWFAGQSSWFRKRFHCCPACGARFSSLQESP